MTYVHKPATSAQGLRKGHDNIRLHITRDEWLAVWGAWEKAAAGRSMGIFASAAILWFGSLDRDQQHRLVFAYPATKAHHNIYVIDWVGEMARGWNFPLSTLGVVVSAAVVQFSQLASDEQRAWALAVHIGPVGGGAQP